MAMPYSRSFQVRYYECDAFGHLNNANYLRFIQETAIDASTSVGYDLAWYSQTGSKWMLFETDIEYLYPILYRDTVRVNSWVTGNNRDVIRRVFELFVEDPSRVSAKAVTHWIYMNADTSKPENIPQEMIEAFIADGNPEQIQTLIPFPSLPDPPERKFEMEITVTWQDIDAARIVNNSVFLNYVEECGMQVIAAHGWPIDRMLEEGFAILIRKHHFQYRQPARLNDQLVISTWASNVRRSTAVRHYSIRNKATDELLAIIHSLGVWVDLRSGRPIRIPENLLADFSPNLVL